MRIGKNPAYKMHKLSGKNIHQFKSEGFAFLCPDSRLNKSSAQKLIGLIKTSQDEILDNKLIVQQN